ncbi:terminase large subunit [Clostridium botulinum]|nr:terminase large subunit [Clostridium botulinum]MCS4446201.1 terminase large subunit [Clostridium botulinum]MCS4461090.1 terminase large subunit [Clostridium botulinum]MCS4513299.1 terminase large subunit [Clostridium botulinum]MCS4518664.1 terminase large subunit [Clostridium botulinum]
MLNEESAPLVKEKAGSSRVTCDSAEPKSVAEYKKLRVNAKSAKKGAGSIEYGIKFLQGLEIIIHPRCQNFRNEISKYKYKEDKNGNILPMPVDKDNHLIDAFRYSLENDMNGNSISFD